MSGCFGNTRHDRWLERQVWENAREYDAQERAEEEERMENSDWMPGHTAPKDGTRIELLWHNGKKDTGFWCKWKYPDLIHDEKIRALGGEWDTDLGEAEADEYEPMGWRHLS